MTRDSDTYADRKALTLHQPWASLIALGVKSIETRSWSTSYRGPLAIHAGKEEPTTPMPLGHGCVVEIKGEGPVWMDEAHDGEWLALPLGAVVATCQLVAVVPMIDHCGTDMGAPAHLCESTGALLLHRPEDAPFDDGTTERDVTDQLPFGDFTPGRFAWLLEDVKPVDPPIPARGHQGLWPYKDAYPAKEEGT